MLLRRKARRSSWTNIPRPRQRVLVEAARARLAELEAACTIDKARVDSLQAGLFQRL